MERRDVMVRQVSRTFALSIEQLPDPLRDAVSVAYLMFRVADGIEDHATLPLDRKVALLRDWADVLDGVCPPERLAAGVADLDAADPEVEVIREAPLVLNWFHALPAAAQAPIRHHVHATTLGMARWQEHGPFVEDEAELDDYMHEVAGRVGYLVTDLFALQSEEIAAQREALLPLSRECGLALQTVNVIRGIRKDYERGWVFVPRAFYRPLGLSRHTLLDPAHEPQALAVVARLADKADRHLEHGLAFISAFPRHEHSLRLALMWPFLFAARTLALSRNNPDVLRREAKMTRVEIGGIVAQTRLFGRSNRWLAQYYRRLAAAPDNGRPPALSVAAETGGP
ncbi:phytoene/squalene synthase family protein [Promineifilum sp.]|uniref:phytoene/squalene synthase family protein n=1 Tax=Promineifilum sp. TaxID=2664178 RepID=UPI0035B2FFA1